MPERVKLSRKKGWRMPPNTVKVDRSTKWGNPMRVGTHHLEQTFCDCDGLKGTVQVDAGAAVSIFYAWMRGESYDAMPPLNKRPDLSDLRGKNLACWCPLDQPCHADVLLELANKDDSDG